jgi:hypothetical protein
LGNLALRVCGTEYDGHIVRLVARKCTIGSGENCTLRLRACGVERVHCVILRGERGLAVRRWSRRTRLNGGAFLDAPLRPGDKLGIGPLELEVVESPVPESPDAPSAAVPKSESLSDWADRFAELESLLAEQTSIADNERRRSAALHSEAESGRRRAEEELHARAEEWQRERAEWAAQLEQARAAGLTSSIPEERLIELEAANASLEERRRRAEDEASRALEKAGYWEQVAASRPADSTEAHEALRLRIEELERELRQARDTTEQALRAQQDASARERDDHAGRERGAWEAELIDLRRELDETRRSLGAERDDLQAQLVAVQEASAVRVSPEQFQAERRDWEHSLAGLKAELEEVRRSRDVERARLENELADLRRAMAEKAVEAGPREEERDDAAEIERERNQLLRQREVQNRELEEAREQLAQFKAKLQERSQALDAREAELKEQAETLEQAKLAAASAAPITPAGGAPEAPDEPEFLGTLVLPRRESVDVPLNAPAPKQESVAEMLARMGHAPTWQEEESPAEAPSEPPPAASLPPRLGAPAPEPGSEEDESIEVYMNRLLQRVRGDDIGSSYRAPAPATRTVGPPTRTSPAPALRPAPAAPAPKPEAASRSSASGPAPPSETMSPEEFVPRSQAPERSERLAAMRDLANSSARSAIGRYTRTRWLVNALIRLGLTAGAAAASFLLILFSPGAPKLALPGAALAAAASVFWATRTLRNAKEYVRAGRPPGPGKPQSK